MTKTFATIVRIFLRDGFAEEGKFVEIDGAKFVPDEADPSKAKVGDDGKPVPFTEKKPETPPATKSLEELAKDNPEIAALLEKDKKRVEEDEKRAKEQKEKEEKEAAEKGQWKELAEKRAQELEAEKQKTAQKEEILGKYVGSVKEILAETLKTIPKEKLGLIPDNFSPREKLEYITKNAKLLGAKVGSGAGGGVGGNDDDPPATEEAKVSKELEDLRKKEKKTEADHEKIFELSKSLKEIRAKAGK